MKDRTRDPGVAIGLAWTPVGGDVLFVEASRMAGGSQLTLTGQLGDVMKESARIALSWFRANASRYGVDPQFYKDAEIHLHVPAGAIPKDGPSAGVTMVDGAGVGAVGPPGARRHGDDRRDHAARAACCPSAASRKRCWRRGALGIHTVILPRQNEKHVNEDLTEELRQRPDRALRRRDGRGAEAALLTARQSTARSGRPTTVFMSTISRSRDERAHVGEA